MGLNDGALLTASEDAFRDLTELNAKSAEMIRGVQKYGIYRNDILELKEFMDRLLGHAGIEK